MFSILYVGLALQPNLLATALSLPFASIHKSKTPPTMKPSILLPLVALLLSVIAHGQTEDYDISNYKARYDRRPQLFVDPSSSFSGEYSNDNQPVNNWQFNTPVFWQEWRNTDQQISLWQLESNLSGSWSAMNRSSGPSERSRLSAFVSSSIQRLNFYRPNRFWGWRASSGMSFRRSNQPNLDDPSSSFSLNGSLYQGWGRIEFAEDALLANWMLQDLAAAGVVQSYGPEEAETLARTITDIIGNRTFDRRRRRIYELEQLYQTLIESGSVAEESFPLFAIINDNWAFANRTVLRHGQMFRYGAEVGNAGQRATLSNNAVRRTLDNRVSLFTGYERARIRNNNGNGSWILWASLDRYFEHSRFDGEETDLDAFGWYFFGQAAYTRRWLPNSRTLLSWSNRLLYSKYWEQRGPIASNPLLLFPLRPSSSFNLEYFIDYHWSFQLDANVTALYRSADERFYIAPTFQFSTRYFIL